MAIKDRQIIKPAAVTVCCLAAMSVLAALTSPVRNIAYAALFFVLLMVFMVSVGYLAVRLQTGTVSSRARYRIFIISSFLLLLAMFRSAQSLSWVDVLILVLVFAGLLFYSDRRSV